MNEVAFALDAHYAGRLCVWRLLVFAVSSVASVALDRALYAAWWWIVVASGYFLYGCHDAHAQSTLLCRRIARIMLAALRVPLGDRIERIPPGNAMLVFNHSSYMDVMVLAVLPGEPAYVAKKELRDKFCRSVPASPGVLFVERFDVTSSPPIPKR
jgi:hypothetical protein